MRHLFLSPHLDDAPLSCGGRIHQLTRAGHRPLVVTVCAGDPPDGPLSDYARSLHERWGQPPERARAAAAEMMATRRAEDLAAIERLGAEALHLELPDVIYRRGADGDWLVGSDEALFAGFRPADAGLVEALAQRLVDLVGDVEADAATVASGGSDHDKGSEDGARSDDGAGPDDGAGSNDGEFDSGRLYVPLSVGDHADHHLTRRAAERAAMLEPSLAAGLRYYEDYPYARDPDRLAQAVRDASSGGSWRSSAVALRSEDMEARIEAVACYPSQISTFWEDLEDMQADLRGFALARGYGLGPVEVYWRREPGPAGG